MDIKSKRFRNLKTARSSNAGELHPHVLTEPDVNLSIHPALIDPPWVSTPVANEQTSRVLGVRYGQANEPPAVSYAEGL
jgi:hypothetical protein